MKVQDDPPLHLTYCLNIHPGESWDDQFSAIRDKATAVRDKVGRPGPFGLGLRVSDQASHELIEPGRMAELQSLLKAENLYVFTINGFPYGAFHGASVKERVYQPDWRQPERLAYTKRLIDILAQLLPDNCAGSISTVPCSYKAWIESAEDVQRMVANLIECAEHAGVVERDTGKYIHLGLEPEPSCYLETTEETVALFKNHIWRRSDDALRRHLGVCLDTCHVAIQFEDPSEVVERYAEEGLLISKVQLSSALDAPVTDAALDALATFDEPVYLHQVRALRENGMVMGWNDLPEGLAALRQGGDVDRIRAHFHVPLFWEGSDALASTSPAISSAFLSRLRHGLTQHLEIETYTFEVLPPDLQARDVVESISREYEWLFAINH